MEREKTGLDGKSDCQDSGTECQCHKHPGILRHLCDGFLHGNHQKMTGQIIEQDHAQQKETGSQKVQDHIAHSCQRSASDLTNDQRAAACESKDLQKYIAREKVIGPENGHQGRRHQIEDGVVEVDLALVHICVDIAVACQNRDDHDDHKEHCQQSFQNARPELIAPGCRKFAHGIGNCHPCGHGIPQDRTADDQQKHFIKNRIIPGCSPFQHKAQRAGKQTQDYRHHWKISDNIQLSVLHTVH